MSETHYEWHALSDGETKDLLKEIFDITKNEKKNEKQEAAAFRKIAKLVKQKIKPKA